jgi:TolB-like protein
VDQLQRQTACELAHLRVHASLFGEFKIKTPGGHDIPISNRRAKAILAMLCLDSDDPIDRDQISKLLWSGRFESHARASLRQCLLDLGKLLEPLGCNILLVTRNSLSLNKEAITSDLGELETALANQDAVGAAKRILAIVNLPLVNQMDFGEAFQSWLSNRRLQVDQRLKIAVDEALAAAAICGDMDGHAALAKAWALHIPTASTIITAPSAKTKTRIAVLPFQALNTKEGSDYFADGVVDEMITTLGQVPQLLVAGRTSSFHFRDSDLPSPTIAKALGVAHLIEGSVQRQGDRVRIHAHLIDGDTGFEVWGERFDGTLDDVFSLQEDIAQAVTAAISNVLGIAMRPPQLRGLTHSKAAYDLFLQGRSLCARVFGDGILDRAVTLFEEALLLDPDFAECWVWLAEAHQLVAVYTQCLDRNAASLRMAACAERAISLAPELGYPHSLLGVHKWTQNDIVGGLDSAFEGYRREPENPAVTMRLGSFLIYCGRTQQARPYVDAAIEQDPVDPRKHALLWAIHMGSGDLQSAQATGQRMVDLGWPSMYLAIASAALGQHDVAVEQYQHTKRLVNTIILPPVGSATMTPELMDTYWQVAAKGICSGHEADRLIYAQWLEMMHNTLHDKADLAITGPAVFTGNAELVFKSLGDHISPANTLAFVALWCDLDPIRQIWQHEEFIPFAQRIGMAKAWDKYGWPDLLPPPPNL